ncbi:MAG TPA: hypothetical protein VFS16_10160 [Acidimicrobiia bacterium]|nr:hypothetical protein [Acidimicrobiia bacterium]
MGVLAMALLVAGCGDDDGGGSAENLNEGNATTSSTGSTGSTAAAAAGECKLEGATTEAATQQVVLTLNEWTIKPSIEPKAGVVTFVAENAGKEPHELVIVKGDKAEALPKDADGGMDEDKLAEGALIGEIEPFPGGQLCKGAFTLAAGKYVLLCNIVETEPSGEKESHFKEGMHTPFVVS